MPSIGLTLSRSLLELPDPLRAALANATVFYTEEYHRFIEGQGKQLSYLHNGTDIIPVILSQKLFFRYADFATEPFSVSGAQTPESQKAFLDDASRHLAEKCAVQWTRQTPVTALFDSYPRASKRIPFGSYLIDLTKTEEAIWEAFSTSYKKYGRQCRTAGAEIKVGGAELLDDFYALLQASLSRAEAGIEPKEYYGKLLSAMGQFAKIFIIYKEGKPEASVLIIFNKERSYTLFGGICNSPHKGSNILLYYEAMRWLKAFGTKSFSFVGCRINVDEGSKYAGIQTFKERFGGELKQGFMFKIIHKPLNCKLFSLIQSARMLSKGQRYPGDVIDQEIHKWKDLQK